MYRNAASLGYFKDDYSHFFLKNKKKMLPIINRGTWARVQGVRSVITRYLKAFSGHEGKIQIVSLGAGYDTTYFWIQDQIASGQLSEELKDKIVYVEVDYFDVVYKKLHDIKKTESLVKKIWNSIEEVQAPHPVHEFELLLDTPHYKIIPTDLRDTDRLSTKFTSTQVDPTAPTFLLAECLLVYLKPDESKKILTFLRDYFTGDLALLNYEMINPSDPFGRVMLENLEDRGCRLQGIHEVPNEAAQCVRMKEVLGMTQAECYNMSVVYSTKIDAAERTRIEKIEIFDEFEEWDLLQSHYCMCLGKRMKDEERGKEIHI